MKKVLVTGAGGFIGSNLTEALSRMPDIKVQTFDIENDAADLIRLAAESDIIYHLAGVNRPENDEEFFRGNSGLTDRLINGLLEKGRSPMIVLSSSIQAALDNPYGISKRLAEEAVLRYMDRTGANCYIFRLPNVFGKWCRPNYNSVVATFCYNISRGLDITISDPGKELKLVYIDDVVKAFISIIAIEGKEEGAICGKPLLIRGDDGFYSIGKVFRTTLGELAERIYRLRDIRKTLLMPDLSDDFMRCLHSTYISYLDKNELAYDADVKSDARGSLFELIKSEKAGQIFVSRSYKNIKRGNHYHDSKVEKFCLVQGEADIKLRNVFSGETVMYHVSDKKIQIVDIPPGYTHSIENTGNGEMIVIFWSGNLFDPKNPDTYYEEV